MHVQFSLKWNNLKETHCHIKGLGLCPLFCALEFEIKISFHICIKTNPSHPIPHLYPPIICQALFQPHFSFPALSLHDYQLDRGSLKVVCPFPPRMLPDLMISSRTLCFALITQSLNLNFYHTAQETE